MLILSWLSPSVMALSRSDRALMTVLSLLSASDFLLSQISVILLVLNRMARHFIKLSSFFCMIRYSTRTAELEKRQKARY